MLALSHIVEAVWMCHVVWRIEKTVPLPGDMLSQFNIAKHGEPLFIFAVVLFNALLFSFWAVGKVKRS